MGWSVGLSNKLIYHVIKFLGMEAVFSWKTTRELISFPQHTDGKYFISFMEKNGLKHGDFVIPSTINVSSRTKEIFICLLNINFVYL